MKICTYCGRQKHKGLCNMIRLSDGRVVHADRVDSYEGDVHEQITMGQVKVINRYIKRDEKKLA